VKIGISLEIIKQKAWIGFCEEGLEAIFYLGGKFQVLIGEVSKMMNMR
jgi:hypothetical protein